jgi:hypothetical protein
MQESCEIYVFNTEKKSHIIEFFAYIQPSFNTF